MTQPNQSELKKQLERYRTWAESIVLGTTLTMKSEKLLDKKGLLDYITANYTPNSEVKKLQLESYSKGYIDGGIYELTKLKIIGPTD